jgi:uncharacterized protein (TIGR02118 family)
MVCLTVMYPQKSGSTFDWGYYLGGHLELAYRLLRPFGLTRIEIDRGMGGFPPGSPAPFYAIARLPFPSLEALQSALAATAGALVADQAKYYSGESVVQISEEVPA